MSMILSAEYMHSNLPNVHEYVSDLTLVQKQKGPHTVIQLCNRKIYCSKRY
jgi:hypothetical protein